jgi:hypothetical protein
MENKVHTIESVAALNVVIKEASKRLYSNYIKITGKWMRRSSAELDRLCEQLGAFFRFVFLSLVAFALL